MIAQTQLKKPCNWQDFEKLCKLLWGEIWACEDTIKRNGRQGQNQHGVDVYVFVDKYGGYCGIQCKGKDDYSQAQLTESEIDTEIEKAKTFEPELKVLVFATTANKDANIEGYIRKKDIENRKNGLFIVDIASWEDIVDQLERYRTTYNWYVNNCQFKDATDISVSFDGKEEVTICPEYIRTTTQYNFVSRTETETDMLKKMGELNLSYRPMTLSWSQPKRIDKRWCKLHIHIENIGSTVIKSSKLIVFFRDEDVEDISDRFSYCDDMLLDGATKAQINASKDARREVFQTYRNVIEYRPKESTFVQKDERNFTISIIAAEGVAQLPMGWQFLCEDYQKEGCLLINVNPIYEEQKKNIVVYSREDVKPDAVTISPKIIED